jgi:hypothetical protein
VCCGAKPEPHDGRLLFDHGVNVCLDDCFAGPKQELAGTWQLTNNAHTQVSMRFRRAKVRSTRCLDAMHSMLTKTQPLHPSVLAKLDVTPDVLLGVKPRESRQREPVSVAWSDDGNQLTVGTNDGSVHFFDLVHQEDVREQLAALEQDPVDIDSQQWQ